MANLFLLCYFWHIDKVTKMNSIDFRSKYDSLSWGWDIGKIEWLVALFWLCRAFLGVRFRFKNVFSIYYCRLATLAFKVQTIVFSNLAQNGVILPFLGPSKLFWGLGTDSTILSGPTYVDFQLCFLYQSPMFSFIQPYMGPFLPFLDPLGLFWDWGLVQKIFGTY